MNAQVIALLLTITFAGASTAAAASITIGGLTGTTYTTGGVRDSSTAGNQMNGMEVTAYWTSNGGAQMSETRVWHHGVRFAGPSLDLVISGDTLNTDAWELDFNAAGIGRLQRLEFNGVPGSTVFDRTSQGMGTSGSDRGKDLDGFGPYDQGKIVVTYSNQVLLDGDPFPGDLYAAITIDFLGDGGLNEGSDWHFSLDADLADLEIGVSNTAPTAVPEPASIVLLGTGLLGLAAIARRRS